jgi:ketosteroid isomerase-like protein
VTSANVELVRSIYAAWERRDYSSSEWAHPDIETVIADGPAPGSWTGVAGAAEGWRDFLNAWEEYRAKAEDYRELDDERVLVLIRRSGRGKRSGFELGEIASKGAVLYHIRSGRVTRQVVYFDRGRALADLGLTSKTSSSHR